MSARLKILNPDERQAFSNEDLVVNIVRDPSEVLDADGALTTTNPDGSVVVDFNPKKEPVFDKGFYTNLAEDKIEEGELDRIANDLLRDIDGDIRSMDEWLRIRERGIELLGYKLEDPRGDLGPSSAPLEGMSTVRHPILSEAVLRFQANARGELLPASGPVKVRNDTPPQPEGVTGLQETEDLSEALEIDLNHYLTVIAREYYPDTDRMLFQVGFGGLGVKKVYNCPLRRRPVSESIEVSDFIVSNATTDLRSAGRITHRIKMRPSILKRMQLVKAYRDVPLMFSQPVAVNPVDKKVSELHGIKPQTSVLRPEDQDQEIFETYCELNIAGMEHKENGEETGLRLPYKVSIHVPSRKVLEVRRNWLKNDKMFMPREYFVDFPFVSAFGFYPLGLVHILGNIAITLTAGWRETLDSGMFASFPGFIYSKQAGRQLSNQFRVPPGGGIGLDVGGGPLKDAIMPLPYKDVSAAFAGFLKEVQDYGQRLGSTAEMNIGEGKQEAPVGTTLALIEQATKMMDAVHKRLHSSQDREFQLLKERFKEDPEAFWRFNNHPSVNWQKEQFLQALSNSKIVPVADPNNPTSLHRIAKATGIKELQKVSPNLYDPMAVDKRIMRIVGVDPEGLFLPEPAPSPPDPRLEAIREKSKSEQIRANINMLQSKIKAATQAQASQDKEADRASRERIELLKIHREAIDSEQNNQREAFKTQHEVRRKAYEGQQKLQQSHMEHQQKMQQQREQSAMDLQVEREKGRMQLMGEAQKIQAQSQIQQLQVQQQAQNAETAGRAKAQQGMVAADVKMRQSDEAHQQKMRQTEEKHKSDLKQAKAMAKVKPKPKSSK